MFEMKSTLEIRKDKLSLIHGKPIVLIGSCFSTEIGNRFSNAGFETVHNSFGTIFHPTAIAKLLSFPMNFEDSIFQKEEYYLSWNAAGTLWNMDKEELLLDLNNKHAHLHAQLKAAQALFITFGTAWEYFNIQTDETVANCHKMNSNLFEKRLTSTADLISNARCCIEGLNSLYPNLTIILTVSPVRHLRDGIIENNRSKARLLEMVHTLCETHSAYVSYFPSYDLILDDLRDYRFFEADLAHPNKQAIDYVWSGIQTKYMDAATLSLCKKVENARTLVQHKTIHVGTREAEKLEQKKTQILSEMRSNPLIYWD
jgi:hypothetical protein